ncbi:hypothetical protein Tco_0679711 [Tanacetum coccineum]|uniref:Uncharacterized protein n=1 Tax=Tanacetum coccineum TaxID=301880 RepID=A0ABQ4XIQ3_9ASTR
MRLMWADFGMGKWLKTHVFVSRLGGLRGDWVEAAVECYSVVKSDANVRYSLLMAVEGKKFKGRRHGRAQPKWVAGELGKGEFGLFHPAMPTQVLIWLIDQVIEGCTVVSSRGCAILMLYLLTMSIVYVDVFGNHKEVSTATMVDDPDKSEHGSTLSNGKTRSHLTQASKTQKSQLFHDNTANQTDDDIANHLCKHDRKDNESETNCGTSQQQTSGTDISQKDGKPIKKRQNRTRDGKVCGDEAKSK